MNPLRKIVSGKSPRLGYRPNPPDDRDLSIDALSLGQASANGRVLFVPEILDQGSTSSCVGHAMATAVGVMEVENNLLYEPASPWFVYYHSRLQHGDEKVDGGTYIRTACDAARHEGMPATQYWDRGALNFRVNRQPGRNAYRFAHGRRGLSYYRIKGFADEKLLQIRAAIDAGLPVIFGSTVRQSFLDWNGPDVIDAPKQSEPVAGGHAMCMVGYDSARGFKIVNSWGTRWRDHGCAWLTPDYVIGFCRDETVISGWERLAKGRKVA